MSTLLTPLHTKITYIEHGESEQTLLSAIEDHSNRGKSFYCYGGWGIGKTALLDFLEQELDSKAIVLRLNIDAFHIDSPSFLEEELWRFLKKYDIDERKVPVLAKGNIKGRLKKTLRSAAIGVHLNGEGAAISVDAPFLENMRLLRDTFSESVKSLEPADKRYSREMADLFCSMYETVVESRSGIANWDAPQLVILADEFEFADRVILDFIDSVFRATSCTLVTCSSVPREALKEQAIKDFFQELQFPSAHTRLSHVRLAPFNEFQPIPPWESKDIHDFLSNLRADVSMQNAEEIKRTTGGIPLFVFVAAQLIDCGSSIARIDEKALFDTYYSRCTAQGEFAEIALKCLALCGGFLPYSIAQCAAKATSAKDLGQGLEELECFGVIAKRADGYYLSIPLFQQYLTERFAQRLDCREIASDTLALFRSEIVEPDASTYIPAVHLAIHADEKLSVIEYALRGHQKLKDCMKPAAAERLLALAINNTGDAAPADDKYKLLSLYVTTCYFNGHLEESLRAFDQMEAPDDDASSVDSYESAAVSACKAAYYLNDGSKASQCAAIATQSVNTYRELEGRL